MVTEHPEVAPGGVLRFGVDDLERDVRSTQYRVWTSKNTDDVYVAGRDAGHWIKASLHESGRWQHGLTKDAQDDGWITAGGAGRHFQRWDRPAEVAPGITLAMRILVPTSQLRSGPSTTSSKREPYYIVPPPREADAVSFDLYLTTPDAPVLELREAMPVGTLRLARGGGVLVVALATHLAADPDMVFKQELDDARREAAEDGSGDLPLGLHPRIVLHMIDEDLRTLKLIEMAVDLERGGHEQPD